MGRPVQLQIQVVDAGQFVRADATGKVDLAASLRMARELSAFGGEDNVLPILLDVRGLSGALSTLDMVEFVKVLMTERDRYRRKVALLARGDGQQDRAHFLELYSTNRGIPIAAFTDYDSALKWLGEP